MPGPIHRLDKYRNPPPVLSPGARLLERGMRRAADVDAAHAGLASGDELLDRLVGRMESLPPATEPAPDRRQVRQAQLAQAHALQQASQMGTLAGEMLARRYVGGGPALGSFDLEREFATCATNAERFAKLTELLRK